jgi:hypothetical protein
LLATACGRIDFDDQLASDAGGSIGWVKPAAAHAAFGTFTSDTFVVSAAQVGNAIVLHVECDSTSQPTAVSLTAPGWTFVQLSPITGSTTGEWAASFGAVAPDVASDSVTVTWTSGSPCSAIDELGDEFEGNDPAGGTTTFDAHAEQGGTDSACATTVVTQHAGDAIWAACTDTALTAPGLGFTMSVDDMAGDWTEYMLASDPTNTPEAVSFAHTSTSNYVVTAVSIRPR